MSGGNSQLIVTCCCCSTRRIWASRPRISGLPAHREKLWPCMIAPTSIPFMSTMRVRV